MNPRVLVVDDDRFMVRTLSDVLRLRGWEVTTANSGAEAVERVRSGHVDVVLMDVKMPGMNGVEALKAMRAESPNIKVMLMTAYSAQALLDEAERAGVTRIMAKPVNVASLLEILTRCVEPRTPILIVDSDASFLRTLSEVLTLNGFETVMARTLEEAEGFMTELHPRAVLLHLHLGALDVGTAITTVHAADPGASLIVYSGQPCPEEEIPAAVPRNWVRAILQKPFAVDHVTGVLNAVSAS